MQNFPLRLLSLVIFFCLAGCSTVKHAAGDDWIGFKETGQASYYADKHLNRKTASGEIYRHELKTAAHKELPFGATVKVTNLANGKSVIVKINDRGPFVEGRIIDLSKSAFGSIASTASGVITVTIEVIR